VTIIYKAQEFTDLQPNPNQSQTLETHLVMDELPMTATMAITPYRVTPNQTEPQESSSIEISATTPVPSTWGEYKQEIPVLDLWNDYQPPQQPNYLHRYCSICEAAMVTLNPFKALICHECKQNIQQEDITPQDIHKDVNEERDDEEEFVFHGIPIAGENKGDSEEDWYDSDESEQEEEVLHNNFTSILINAAATEDIAFLVGPTQDGQIKLPTRTPLPTYLNPYQILNEEHLFLTQPDDTPITWSNACVAEFQRHLPYIVFPAVTNAQRLAHPWKTRRQEANR
jgi:hypothetical protein